MRTMLSKRTLQAILVWCVAHMVQSLEVGILYEGWHGPAAAAQANITARGGSPLNVEAVNVRTYYLNS